MAPENETTTPDPTADPAAADPNTQDQTTAENTDEPDVDDETLIEVLGFLGMKPSEVYAVGQGDYDGTEYIEVSTAAGSVLAVLPGEDEPTLCIVSRPLSQSERDAGLVAVNLDNHYLPTIGYFLGAVDKPISAGDRNLRRLELNADKDRKTGIGKNTSHDIAPPDVEPDAKDVIRGELQQLTDAALGVEVDPHGKNPAQVADERNAARAEAIERLVTARFGEGEKEGSKAAAVRAEQISELGVEDVGQVVGGGISNEDLADQTDDTILKLSSNELRAYMADHDVVDVPNAIIPRLQKAELRKVAAAREIDLTDVRDLLKDIREAILPAPGPENKKQVKAAAKKELAGKS